MTSEGLIDILKALGHPLRLRIIEALQGGERSVSELEDATGIVQPALSQQLAVIRSAGLVQTRKAAKLVFYRIDQETFRALHDRIGHLAPAPASTEGNAHANRRDAAGAAHFARLS